MNKYIVLTLVTLGLVACGAKDEQYYRSHPKEIQKGLESCPAKQPEGMSCQQLQQLGQRMNNLAFQLQSSPQGFGAKILALQESLAKEEQELSIKESPELKQAIAQKKHTLAEYMAVVKWLESPES
ncbi:hypothetical protein [Legionella sp. km772]|uniref:hypothetical protein n=1 Tax=Legionella sp. km772 TaxID=2498111 RepID=UPI000F8D1A1C|nr:hypothetical protein [Legionella sp. km772]RUR12367.1 hypothetical protein ELY15_05270 [Legionella sp. km772]